MDCSHTFRIFKKTMILELVRRRARQLSNDTLLSIEVNIGFYFYYYKLLMFRWGPKSFL